MNDLIIDGVDHAKFDLEWAKRGGVLICADPESTKKLFKFVRNIDLEKIEVTVLGWFDWCPVTNFLESKTIFRMATPSECAEAGVEYIEPPMVWRDIESAPKNTWVIATDGFYVTEAFFTTSRNAWVMKGCGELSVTHWMTKPQPPKDE